MLLHAERKRKGKELYLSVEFTLRKVNANGGHCKLKLTQIKPYQMKFFEERGKPEYPRKTSQSRVEN